MTTNYKNAGGDYRGVLERYLPTAYKTIANGNDTHKGLLGALKQMLTTTESDVIQETQKVFLSRATGWALDLYGSWVGEDRNNQSDDIYRQRIVDRITLGRDTVANVISGIKRELNDSELTVNIYEPWRNIFYLNRSLLNGADRIMGNFYRYAIIQITLNKHVNPLQLQTIVDKYKAAGISAVFVYRQEIISGDGALLSLPLQMINEGRNITTTLATQESGKLLMNGLPTGTLATDLFIVNNSDLNGTDVLASDPNSVYGNLYGSVPSKNIFGTTASGAMMTDDPYDFVYQQSKVDMSTTGTRNLFKDSRALSHTINPNGTTITVEPFDSTTNMWHIVGPAEEGFAGFYMYGYGSEVGLKEGDIWAFSADVKGTGEINVMGIETGTHSPQPSGTLTSDWKRMSQTGVAGSGLSLVVYFHTPATSGVDAYIKLPKLETGNVPTDWSPAPEDAPKTYIYPYTGMDYTALNRKDGVVENITAGGLPTVSFNISEYLKQSLSSRTSAGSKSVDYTNFSNPVSAINVNLKGSPFGLSPTTINVTSQGGVSLTGKWYHNGNVVSSSTQISNSSTSTGTWSFKLDTPSVISSIALIDNYPDDIGAYRVVSMTTTDNRNLALLNTTQQVTGTINVLRLQSQTPEVYRAYAESIKVGDTTLTSPQVFDPNSGNWLDVTKDTELVHYLSYGNITESLYITLRNKVTQQKIDYIGLDVIQAVVE